ncbi:MAG: hypothetical protein Q4B52_07800 [Tissierellia bacterium]|nr:hypothetical protein [Tissierellia bacterium]
MDRKIKIFTEIQDSDGERKESSKTLTNVSNEADNEALKNLAQAVGNLYEGGFIKAEKIETSQL